MLFERRKMPSSPRVCSPLRKEFKRAFEETEPLSASSVHSITVGTSNSSSSSAAIVYDSQQQQQEKRVSSRRFSSSKAANFTLRKEEFKNVEDFELVKDYAVWLTGAGDRYISEKNFEHDLSDGVALCTIMSKIQGSGVTNFHKVAPIGGHKARENFITFQVSVQRLHLPSTFGLEDLENRNYSDIFSTLLFLAHTCHSQDVANDAMTDPLLEKLEEIDEVLEDAFGPMDIEASAQTMEESLVDMQRSMSANAAAMMKLMSDDIERSRTPVVEKEEEWYQSVAKYMSTLKDLRTRYGIARPDQVIIDRSVQIKNALPTPVRNRIESLSGSIASKMDQLPDSIKSKMPIGTIKRFG